jgi:cell wall-associated NlpC family hydrolase
VVPLRSAPALALGVLLVACSPAAAATHLGDRPLRLGARGHDVRVLQDLLTRSGHVAGVDGRFGPGTRVAVRAFQRDAGLAASGVVGRTTVAALRGAPVPATYRSTAVATIDAAGLAHAPPGAPPAVVQAIAAANAIAALPYRWGGGHRSATDTAYDCSGSVSFALIGAALLDAPLDSAALQAWGAPGAGAWITVYASPAHAFAVIAGLRFDTSGRTKAGTRWQTSARSTDSFTARHPAGL